MWISYKNTAMEDNFWIISPNWNPLALGKDWYTMWICKAHQVFPIYALIDTSKKKIDHIVCSLYDDWKCSVNTRVAPNSDVICCSNKVATLGVKTRYEK